MRLACFGDEVRYLVRGLRAEPGQASRQRVIPARFAGEVVRPEAFHAVHQLDGLLFLTLVEEARDLAERLAEELGGQAG